MKFLREYKAVSIPRPYILSLPELLFLEDNVVNQQVAVHLLQGEIYTKKCTSLQFRHRRCTVEKILVLSSVMNVTELAQMLQAASIYFM